MKIDKWACPKCKSVNLTVVVEINMRLEQEEDNFQTIDDLDGDHEWDGNSVMGCLDCGEQDIADAFQLDEPLPESVVQARAGLIPESDWE